MFLVVSSPLIEVTINDPISSGILLEGTHNSLVCNASFDRGVNADIVTIEWFKNDSRITDGFNQSIGAVSGNFKSTLTVTETNSTDHVAAYKCSAYATTSESEFYIGSFASDVILIEIQGLPWYLC